MFADFISSGFRAFYMLINQAIFKINASYFKLKCLLRDDIKTLNGLSGPYWGVAKGPYGYSVIKG